MSPRGNASWTTEIEWAKSAPVAALVARYEELFGEQSPTRHRMALVRKISWRLQANHYGGLSEKALERARALADERGVRLTAPEPHKKRGARGRIPSRDPRLPLPGSMVTRQYAGRQIAVKVLANGFEYEGTRFASLSGVAEHVTGTRWNGFLFFRLETRKRER
jgi:hypothetical protein